MNANEIMQMVNSLGFPIIMCGFFAWYLVKRDAKDTERDNQHREEVEKLSEAINNNTLVMQQIIDKLGK